MPWIDVAPGAPYFVTENGAPWTPIGQNDSVSWVDLDGLFRRRDTAGADAYFATLVDNGVTCLRFMLECAEHEARYLENPVGTFVPEMVQFWDDVFARCERFGLRLLLTPVDTFWTWLKWDRHPYNRCNGGPLESPSVWLLDPAARAAIKDRLTFAVRRWGGSGALFAWDLWNEIHPAQARGQAEPFDGFVADLGGHVRELETALYGRAHLQTVSLFGPELEWQSHLDLATPIYRHPDLDFATIHIYAEGTIDLPQDTVAPAIATGRIVRRSLDYIRDDRPFLDTEHGPIHGFKDHGITLPEPFDDEYFRHMQWAHLASGGAGGGLRWPYRNPHRLTLGMRAAQRALSAFLPLVDWPRFRRRSLDVQVADEGEVVVFACGDGRQAVLWCLRTDTIGGDGRLDCHAAPIAPRVLLNDHAEGLYRATFFDTTRGIVVHARERTVTDDGVLALDLPPFVADLAVAITPASWG